MPLSRLTASTPAAPSLGPAGAPASRRPRSWPTPLGQTLAGRHLPRKASHLFEWRPWRNRKTGGATPSGFLTSISTSPTHAHSKAREAAKGKVASMLATTTSSLVRKGSAWCRGHPCGCPLATLPTVLLLNINLPLAGRIRKGQDAIRCKHCFIVGLVTALSFSNKRPSPPTSAWKSETCCYSNCSIVRDAVRGALFVLVRRVINNIRGRTSPCCPDVFRDRTPNDLHDERRATRSIDAKHRAPQTQARKTPRA